MLQLLLSIGLSVFLLACVLVYALCRTWSFRKLSRATKEQAATTLPMVVPTGGVGRDANAGRWQTPRLSIVVAAQNDDWWIERHLLALLEQQAPFPYEVIVADASDADDETKNLVQRWQNDHPHLRYTFVPATHRNLYPRKLALTLGVRAARAPWVVVVEPNSLPPSRQWLQHIALHCTDEHDVVVGWVHPTTDMGTPQGLAQQQEWQARNLGRWLKGKPAAAPSTNVAFRKLWALEQGLFGDSLDLPFGECTLLAVRAQPDRVALALHPHAAVQQERSDDALGRVAQKREQRTLRRRLAKAHICPMCGVRVAKVVRNIGLCLGVLALVLRVLQSVPALNEWCQAQNVLLLWVPYDYWQLAYDVVPAVLWLLLLVQPIFAHSRLKRLFDGWDEEV